MRSASHLRAHLYCFLLLVAASCWVQEEEIRKKIKAIEEEPEGQETGDTGER